jgi:O-antigen biosynthesis protein
MTMPKQSLRYSRPAIDPEGADALARLARWITAPSTVLDLGTAAGALGRHLANRGCMVDGVEQDGVAIWEAEGAYRVLRQADLNTADLLSLFPGERYDAIVCADVLEHLLDPGHVLKQLPGLLKPAGKLLLSVPNVAYLGVILGLLRGEFTYRPLGILDATHVHLYTRSSLLKLLEQNGFYAEEVDSVVVALSESEFRDQLPEAVPLPVLRLLEHRPDVLAYQFVVKATLEPVSAPAPQGAEFERSFSAQLFWRTSADEYDELRSRALIAPLDDGTHSLRFRLPETNFELEGIRLDPCDRPGVVYLYGIAIEKTAGLRLWEWCAGDGPPPVRSLHQLVELPGGPGPSFLSLGTDPSLEIALPRGLMLQGADLVVRLCFSASESGVAAANGVRESQTALVSALGRQAEEQREVRATAEREMQRVLERLNLIEQSLESSQATVRAEIARTGTLLEASVASTRALLSDLLAVRPSLSARAWRTVKELPGVRRSYFLVKRFLRGDP